MTTRTHRPWKRWAFITIVVATAGGIAAAAGGLLNAAIAAAIALLAGVAVSLAIDAWNDHHTPDFAKHFEDSLED